MLDPDFVGYKQRRVVTHHAALSDTGQNVPAGEVIKLIDGDSSDPIASEFLKRLRASATLIGDHTDVVRATVKQNADALKQAADDLMKVDDTAAQDFGAVAAIVNATAADTTDKDVAAVAGAGVNGSSGQSGAGTTNGSTSSGDSPF